MIPEGNLYSNVERFKGFQKEYDRYRPEAPPIVAELLTGYLGARPGLVVDLGCGTGLSTFLWTGRADRIIGVEPGDDMRSRALEKWDALGKPQHISFIQGYSNALELGAEEADIITCSQSFHWMEPVSTLKEAARVLRTGGVFAAYDCDWPPVLEPAIENMYNDLISKADTVIEGRVPPESRALKRNKDEHLSRIRESGVFSFCRELVFHNMERCDAERYVGLTLSQGGMQTVLRLGGGELDEDIALYRQAVEQYFAGRTLDTMFAYRMRLGIK
ncbi:SAM-dependent methyltransferase [Paenibacillus stellifer]|uniref:SAM-dependent methyltransferase n=1 Tax=Paenibacillus stellifer TaxID=169760 RepID=A0A089M0W3_9BACL|nr:class I SAM-dependent methyltransferase [Paenibacillus stellifer]AIQ66040.1 SAM-dependent methyltransferase [Paenibacillus stellifer]